MLDFRVTGSVDGTRTGRANRCYLRYAPLPFLLALFSCAACSREPVESIESTNGGVTWFAKMRTDGAPETGQSGWSTWLTEEWRQDDGARPRFLVVNYECPKGECQIDQEKVVDNCTDLFAADLDKMSTPTHETEAAYAKWHVKCYAARAVSRAMAPQQSFVENFNMDEAGFRSLPPELGFLMSRASDMEAREQVQVQGGTLGDYIHATLPNASVSSSTEQNQNQVVVRFVDHGVHWIQEWNLLAKGDFNEDQLADLLISARVHDDEGAVDGYSLYIVTREQENSPLVLAREVDMMPGWN